MSANHNSQVDFYVDVLRHLHSDVVGASAHVTAIEATRDWKTIQRRVRSEGLSFFTKTLPSIGKAIDKALSNDTPLLIPGFHRKKGTQLPRFLGCLLREVFDDSGCERSDASAVALGHLRQLTYAFYKLELPYDEAAIDKTIANFLAIEKKLEDDELNERGAYSKSKFNKEVERIARHLICNVLASSDPAAINPRHGPGAVSTGERVWEKREFSHYYTDLAEFYPYDKYMFYNMSHLGDELDKLMSMEELEYGTAKVVLVPKDSRGPRLISCEPLEKQWIQQGQNRSIVAATEASVYTRGHVNFVHQEVNRRIALRTSLREEGEQECATLDMKDASDHVSMELVERLFPKRWVQALRASRSSATVLPDGQVVHLRKFAPMGSAVCFPVEALCFWAICVALVHVTRTRNRIPGTVSFRRMCKARRLEVNAQSGLPSAQRCHTDAWDNQSGTAYTFPGIEHALSTIYVYGDDIICSLEDHEAIVHYLPEFSLKVNADKCCSGKSFRESCGCDAFKGVDVTPTKFRAEWSSSLDVRSYPAWVAYSNALDAAGYCSTAMFIEGCIQSIPYTDKKGRVWYNHTPHFDSEEHDGIGFCFADMRAKIQNLGLGIATRFSKRVHVPLVLGFRSLPSIIWTESNGWTEMLRIHSARNLSEDLVDCTDWCSNNTTLEELKTFAQRVRPLLIEAGCYAVPRRNRLKRGWLRLS